MTKHGHAELIRVGGIESELWKFSGVDGHRGSFEQFPSGPAQLCGLLFVESGRNLRPTGYLSSPV